MCVCVLFVCVAESFTVLRIYIYIGEWPSIHSQGYIYIHISYLIYFANIIIYVMYMYTHYEYVNVNMVCMTTTHKPVPSMAHERDVLELWQEFLHRGKDSVTTMFLHKSMFNDLTHLAE